MKSERSFPKFIITEKGARWTDTGHPWIYEGEIISGDDFVVNNKVLEGCGIDTNEYSGFAFGIGLERIAMLKYGINNIKMLFESDMRVLKQLHE